MKIAYIFLCLIGVLYCLEPDVAPIDTQTSTGFEMNQTGSNVSAQTINTELENAHILWRNDFYDFSSSKLGKADYVKSTAIGSFCLLWQANVVDAAIVATKRNKNSWLAALLSFFVPGAGQIYNRQCLKGGGIWCLSNCLLVVMMSHPRRPEFEYSPIKPERELFRHAIKYIYPEEVKTNFLQFSDSLLCWFGIIKAFELNLARDTVDLLFVLEHKYYDYTIKPGIHIERLFLSSVGEGDFIYQNRTFITSDSLKLKQVISKMAQSGNLAICYGYPDITADSNMPVLKGELIILTDEIWFTTEVLSYTIRRDKFGRPIIENVTQIKELKRGKND